ncbi:MAG: hypothetical protein A3B25_02070 [Candidatus Ryanbacteria bacterium RIFCSPLOWO2_01_FULL_48_26]|uniref:Bacterial sugar transferase domain-containing protein n=1 Tax=Candidatus Ryanbacteria bacterium RIFCSPLOWO2_01_FULL_48_26 TaxID=1802126 RepID=A0A1G2GT66_9BACT|nr:MAG: hypothetical protein A3B25_02070 [Candidatus Ryanbacteria bacterium RIFCSPLOWO2_01_FULL_48_26]
MNSRNRAKVFFLFIGDVTVLYASLFITLVLRYAEDFYYQFTNYHALPFAVIFLLWIAVFYISGIYDLKRLRNNLDFIKTLALAIALNGILTAIFFYFLPTTITPKTNLFIFTIIFALIEGIWRRAFNTFAAAGIAPNRVLLVGASTGTKEIAALISVNPQFGYQIVSQLSEDTPRIETAVRDIIARHNVNVIVIPRHLKHNEAFARELYKLLGEGIEIRELSNFYEMIMRKIPLSEVDETWFLEHITDRARFYDQLKRALEIVGAFVLQIILLPIELCVALAIKMTSQGPVIYTQTRVGKGGKKFTLYKFRTMRVDAEKNGAQWSETNDTRTTLIGNILRKTHIDELPQLINIMKGNLSFVGPRPERPEFTSVLKEKIPYFEIRNLVLPGVTGWAQINHSYNAPDADSHEKLQYDIYYIKNRSIILDLAIIIKTIRSFFVNSQ